MTILAYFGEKIKLLRRLSIKVFYARIGWYMDYTPLVLNYVDNFSYLAIFILAFFSGYLIPIPEEIILIIIGYLCTPLLGIMSLPVAIIVCIVSLICSDNLLFHILHHDNRFTKKLREKVFSLQLMKHRNRMEKHIDKTIFLSRFTPFLRFVGPVLAASIKTNKKQFFIFNSLAVIIYTPILILLGYVFSAHLPFLVHKLERIHHFVVIGFWAFIGLVITFLINQYLKRRLKDHPVFGVLTEHIPDLIRGDKE